ncbi:MAG TPA: hypothetical protein VFP84_12400 [Kofleriaceae bacterium]|nr:hypothetical protein [Kofleriaceae bacterium]
MPRKQRFKPSRKPKPIPQNEEAMNGATPQAHNDNAASRPMSDAASDKRDDESLVEPDPDQQSR